MRIPKVTIKGLMITVAVFALDFYLVLEDFAGVFLPILGLNLGLILILRKERTKRRFWVGFEVLGLILLGMYVGMLRYQVDPYFAWPWTFYDFLFDQLSPAAQEAVAPWLDRLLESYPGESEVEMAIWQIILYESTCGLHLVLLATIGGWVWKVVGPKPLAVG
jgi:hypothetical protein